MTHDRAMSPVFEFPNVAGRVAVCKDSFGLFVIVVLCITDGVAVVVMAIIFCAVVCDREDGDSRATGEMCDNCKVIPRLIC